MLKGKNVVLGVTGGIAAYKACEIVSRLKKLNCNVDVIMTKNATNFVAPLTFESLSQRPVTTDMFMRGEWEIEHIALAKKADVFLVVPATANIIGKMACGICDDMLSTTLMATKAQVLVAPAMNSGMYTNEVFQANLKKLKQQGVKIIEPDSGRLACGDVGIGKLAAVESIMQSVVDTLLPKQDYQGKKLIVTAGSTREMIDGVRYISNCSSGKMGVEIAKNAYQRGGDVMLILGGHSVEIPSYLKTTNVITTQEMYQAVMDNLNDSDIVIKAAAPCDFKVAMPFESKLKSKNLSIDFVANKDIACEVGKIKGEKKLVIFALETDNLEQNAKEKLKKKNADLCVANSANVEGAGFGCDTNVVTLITADTVTPLEKLTKTEVAEKILDKVLSLK